MNGVLKRIIERTAIGRKITADKETQVIYFAVFSLIFNLTFAFYNGILGILSSSRWFGSMCVYYLILSIMRFGAILANRKRNLKKEYRTMHCTGFTFCVFGIVLLYITYLSLTENVAVKYGMITMITIATYTFIKIGNAVSKVVRYRKTQSPLASVIRNISYAEVSVSVYTMQRSMLVSFDKGDGSDLTALNIIVGIAVCMFTFTLGILMISNGKRGIKMAKSKILKAEKKVEEAVTGAYKTVEKTVVDGYKTVEKTVVDGYTRIEDAFVDRYLTKDGETVEEAKERLKK